MNLVSSSSTQSLVVVSLPLAAAAAASHVGLEVEDSAFNWLQLNDA